MKTSRAFLAWGAAAFASLGLLASAQAETKKKSPASKTPPKATPAKPAASPAKPAKPAPTVPVPDEATRRDAQLLYDRALVDFQKGDLPAARKGFQAVIAVSPGNAAALVNLALVEQRGRQYADAERYLKEVLVRDLSSASAWLLMGIGAYEEGRLDAAHAHLAQAVLHAPKNAIAHQYLGVVLGRKGWYSAGEASLRRAVELDPNVADSHFSLAVMYLERESPAVELARRHYQRALELGAKPDPEIAKKLELP